jgi:hypothetical protein
MSPTCPTCDGELQPVRPVEAAEHDTVRGKLDGPAAWICPQGHHSLRADVDAALAELHDVLDIAERTLIRGTLRCAACSTPFRLPGRRRTQSVTLVTTGLPATRLTLDVPVLRCTEDAIESIPPECVDDLEVVVRTLLERGA